jgi:hypothetical protein
MPSKIEVDVYIRVRDAETNRITGKVGHMTYRLDGRLYLSQRQILAEETCEWVKHTLDRRKGRMWPMPSPISEDGSE